VAILDQLQLFTSFVGFFLSGWHLYWAGAEPDTWRCLWGRRFGVAGLLVLGLTGLIAAGLRSSWLVPLGLLAGLLIVVMLWESQEPHWDPSSGK
jgi:hypothetical protein